MPDEDEVPDPEDAYEPVGPFNAKGWALQNWRGGETIGKTILGAGRVTPAWRHSLPAAVSGRSLDSLPPFWWSPALGKTLDDFSRQRAAALIGPKRYAPAYSTFAADLYASLDPARSPLWSSVRGVASWNVGKTSAAQIAIDNVFGSWWKTPTFESSWMRGVTAKYASWGRLDGLGISRELLRQSREALRRARLPSNLRELPDVTPEDVLAFTEKHSISLYLVAPHEVARAFLAAEDKASVRRVLDRRSVILAQCRDLLNKCDQLSSAKYRDAALEAIEVLEADFYSASQSLAANVLDSMMGNNHLGYELCDAAKRKKGKSVQQMRDKLEDLDAWQGYIATAMWSAFASYWRSKGDDIPNSFSRNATAHALGSRQYSRRSATQAIMIVVSAVAYMNGLS